MKDETRSSRIYLPCPICGAKDGLRISWNDRESSLLCVRCEEEIVELDYRNLVELINGISKRVDEKHAISRAWFQEFFEGYLGISDEDDDDDDEDDDE